MCYTAALSRQNKSLLLLAASCDVKKTNDLLVRLTELVNKENTGRERDRDRERQGDRERQNRQREREREGTYENIYCTLQYIVSQDSLLVRAPDS